MNIIVCLKQVPATTRIPIDPLTNTLMRQGIPGIINPYDTYALEEGVRLKERYGGRVTVLSMGPPQAEESLREAIGLGADAAVLLGDRAFAGSDTLATSYTLAKAIEKLAPYDLIIAGRQSMDGDTGQIPGGLAEWLGLPLVAYVSTIEEVGDGFMRVWRLVEEGHEVIEAPLPAVISVVKEVNTPRLPSLRGLMRARSAKIPTWTAADLGADPARLGLGGSPTKVTRVFAPERERSGVRLEGDVEAQVEQLVAALKSAHLV